MIRVLVIDASIEIRKILTRYLSFDPSIKVVGVATNLSSAQRQLEKLQPDIITLHEDLNNESVIGTLTASTPRSKEIPILILGDIDNATKQALSEPHPPQTGRSNPSRNRAIVCKTPDERRFTEICRRIHQICSQSEVSIHSSPPPLESTNQEITNAIGIAVSTGGPNALAHILSQLSPDLTAPVLVTQHIPGQFTPLLVERLRSRCSLSIFEAHHNQIIRPGSVYLAPGDQHLTLAYCEGKLSIALSDGPKENSCRPSADVMFRSLAQVFGKSALGIVLTGMGIDGQNGSHYLKTKGGSIIAQDEQSSAVWGMPKAVISAGLADEILSLDEIPHILNLRFTRQKN